MRLRMKVEHEIKIMKWLFWVKRVYNKALTRKGVIQETKIPEGSLHGILARLEKRGWIENEKTWLRIPTKPFTIGEFIDEVNYTYKKKYLTEAGSSEAKKAAGKKEVRKKYIPKEITVYKILKFPYLFGDIRGVTVPIGHKREWRNAAEEAKQELNKYKSDWKESKKNIERKLSRLKTPFTNLMIEEEIEHKRSVLNEELMKLEARKIKPVLLKMSKTIN